jgi:hypothetical protein
MIFNFRSDFGCGNKAEGTALNNSLLNDSYGGKPNNTSIFQRQSNRTY